MLALMSWGVSDEQGWRKGPWTPEEDKLLSDYISLHGDGRWSSVSRFAGLKRTGKSCRLRWVNYLRPGLKRGHLTPQEEGIIIELHALWGNKWSTIARYLPGRTDNEIKNYWRTHFKKKAKPSQRQQKRKVEALRHKKQNQATENDMNISPGHGELNNSEKIITEPQGNQEIVSTYPLIDNHQSSPAVINYQDLTLPWSDTFTEFDLWGGLWNLDDPRDQGYQCNNYKTAAAAAAQSHYSANYNSCGVVDFIGNYQPRV